jgi:hypothetical protein
MSEPKTFQELENYRIELEAETKKWFDSNAEHANMWFKSAQQVEKLEARIKSCEESNRLLINDKEHLLEARNKLNMMIEKLKAELIDIRKYSLGSKADTCDEALAADEAAK